MARAKTFYSELFGWTYRDMPAGAGQVYSQALVDGLPVAALYLAGSTAAPAWTSYITVGNLGAAVAEVARAGGRVVTEPFAILDSGRMALIASPGGATVAFWEPGRHHGASLVGEPGSLCWNELNTRAPDADEVFFARVFEWTYERVAKPQYTSIRNAGRLNGAIVDMRGRVPDQFPAFWNVYFAVTDTDEIAAKARGAGGQIAVGPLDVPAGRFAVVMDPDMVLFSIITMHAPDD